MPKHAQNWASAAPESGRHRPHPCPRRTPRSGLPTRAGHPGKSTRSQARGDRRGEPAGGHRVALGRGSLRRAGVPEAALRGRGSAGCLVRWLIVGPLGLVLLVGLVVIIRGRRRFRHSADDTLVTDLLGPPDLPAVPAPQAQGEGPPSPAAQARGEDRPSPAPRARKERSPSPTAHARAESDPSPAPRARNEGSPSPTAQARKERSPSPVPRAWKEDRPSPAPRARKEDRRSPAAQARKERRPSAASQARAGNGPSPARSALPTGEDDWLETQLAWINAWSQRMKEQITSAEQPEPHGKE
jgi:hypothetical protein